MSIFHFPHKKNNKKTQYGFVSSQSSRATLSDLWQTRYLVWQLIWRDLTVRYRKTWLGGLWALLSPMLNLTLYYIVFGIMIRVSSSDYNAPYVIVLLCGLVPWMLYSSTVNAVSDSLLNNIFLIKKIWFPRTALTIAATGICVVDFLIAVLLLLCSALAFGITLAPTCLPILLLCGAMTAFAGWGMGCILAVLKLRFRDFRHLMPLMMQALFYATSVVWTPGILPLRWQSLVFLNPLNGIIWLVRHSITGGPAPSLVSLISAVSGCIALGITGYAVFSRYEAQVTERE